MENRGFRINLDKTKVMRCCDSSGLIEKSGKYPCGVYGWGVGANSIKCMAWIHKKCSGVSGRLHDVANLQCAKCVGCDNPTKLETTQKIEIGMNEEVECVE